MASFYIDLPRRAARVEECGITSKSSPTSPSANQLALPFRQQPYMAAY